MSFDESPPSSLGSLIDAVPFGLLTFDDNGVIGDLNETLRSWLGVSRDSLLGEHIDRILPPGGRVFYQTHLFPLLRGQGTVSELYFALRAGDGRELPVLLNARRLVVGENPTNILALAVINNRQQFEGALLHAWQSEQAARQESESKTRALDELNLKLEQRNSELVAAEEQLRESNKAKDEFIGLVSHELKNPLAALMGTFAFLNRQLESGSSLEDAHELISGLHREFVRLLSVIDNLLVIARSETGALEDIEPIIVVHAVNAVASRHRTMHAREIRMQAEGESVALASPALTEQILDNLVSNAVKYGLDGTPIEIRLRNSRRFVEVTVSNAGDQLTEDQVRRFFQPFFRDARHRDRAPGVGLGLTVCQRLAEAQDALLAAAPRRGGGLEVTLSLPRAESDPA